MVKFFYWSDIQWGPEKHIALKYLNKKISGANFDVLVLNGDIGEKGELLDNIVEILINNKDKLKDKKIIINLGNHDNFIEGKVAEKILKEKGLNVDVAYEDKYLDIYGLKTLVLPGAHEVSGPGNIAKNAFYYSKQENDLYFGNFSKEGNLLPTGYYLIEQDEYRRPIFKKVDKNLIETLTDFLYYIKTGKLEELDLISKLWEQKMYLEAQLRNIQNLKEKLKDEYKKEIEKDENNIKEQLEYIKNSLNNSNFPKEFLENYLNNKEKILYLFNNLDKLYLHINSKEILEKYKNKEIDVIFSHDPIKHPKDAFMGYVRGVKVNEDKELEFRAILKDKVYKIPIKLKKGLYNKYFKFIPQLKEQVINYALEKYPNLAKEIVNFFDERFESFYNYLIEKNMIEEEPYEASDPYLTDLLNKFAFFGHIEREYRIFDKEGNKVFPNEEKSSIYGLIHSKNWGEYLKDIYLDINKEKGKVIFEDVGEEVISNLY